MTTFPREGAWPEVWIETENSKTTLWLRRLLIVGMVWLIIGMGVMPAGVSYNPSKSYQAVLTLTMWLPALGLMALHPRRLLEFCKLPLMPWVMALLAWGWISLAWSHAPHRVDEAARNLSVLLFLFASQWVFGGNESRARWLLIGCGFVLAAVAVMDMLDYVLHPFTRRLIGIGVMANSNLAAAGMSAALIWLWPWGFQHWVWRAAKCIAIGVLALFVFFTFTRSAWAALFMALVMMAIGRGGRQAWIFAGVISLLGALGASLGIGMLMERGWSLRPQIFVKALGLVAQHPLRGWGQGTPFIIQVGNVSHDHAHNMFMQLAIELGLPAMLLWTFIWLALGWRAWRERHETLGLLVFGLWIFASIAVAFDLPHLLDSPRPVWLITWLPLALSTRFGFRAAGSA